MSKVLQDLKARSSWGLISYWSAQLGLPKAKGWAAFEEKLESEVRDENPDTPINQALTSLCKSVAPLGSRVVQLIRIPDDIDVEKLRSSLIACPEDDGLPKTCFPRRVSGSALTSLGVAPVIVDKEVSADGVRLIFSRVRQIEVRDIKTKSDIGLAAVSSMGWSAYDEIILVKKELTQAFEVVRFDFAKRVLELRVELLAGSNSKEALGSLSEKVQELIAPCVASTAWLGQPVNLFPAVKKIYDNPNEGVVVELGFSTITASAKNEKMRKAGTDLRTEKFHVGGKAAINGQLTPYRLAVSWPQAGSAAGDELLLPGSLRSISLAHPLDQAEIRGALTEQRMVAILEKVLSYI